ncbi:hypothetical protein PCE1_004700 [Barthelona sp. PCE]
MSRTVAATKRLRENLEAQLQRLMVQLNDIEEFRDELDDDEYLETREDTLFQMKDLEKTLEKYITGNMSLTSDFEAFQISIREAYTNAFKITNVISIFLTQSAIELRERLTKLENAFMIKNISREAYVYSKTELLYSIQELNEQLSVKEEQFLQDNMSGLHSFNKSQNQNITKNIVQDASKQINQL